MSISISPHVCYTVSESHRDARMNEIPDKRDVGRYSLKANQYIIIEKQWPMMEYLQVYSTAKL